MPITPLIIRRPDVSPERRELLEDDVSTIQPARSSPPARNGQQHSHPGGRCSIGNFLRARLPCARPVPIQSANDAGEGGSVDAVQEVRESGISRGTGSGMSSAIADGGAGYGESSTTMAGPSRSTAIPASTGSASSARFSPMTPMSSLPPLVSALSSSTSTAFTSTLATPTPPTPLQLNMNEPRMVSTSASPSPVSAPMSMVSRLSPLSTTIGNTGADARKAFPHTADLLGSPSERGHTFGLPTLSNRSGPSAHSSAERDESEDITMAATTPEPFASSGRHALQEADAGLASDGPSLIAPDRRLFPTHQSSSDERLERIRERLVARRVQVGRIRAQEQVRNMERERERERSASRTRETSGNSLAQGMRRSGEYARAGVEVGMEVEQDEGDVGLGRNVRQRLGWDHSSVDRWMTDRTEVDRRQHGISPAEMINPAGAPPSAQSNPEAPRHFAPRTPIGPPRTRPPLGRASPSDRQALAPLPLGPPRPLPDVYTEVHALWADDALDIVYSLEQEHSDGADMDEDEEDEESEDQEDDGSEDEEDAEGSEDEQDDLMNGEGSDVSGERGERGGSETRAVLGGHMDQESIRNDDVEHGTYRDPFLPSPAALFGSNYAAGNSFTDTSASTSSSVDEFARRYRQPGQPAQSLMRSPSSSDRAPLFAGRFGQMRRQRSDLEADDTTGSLSGNSQQFAAAPSPANAFTLGSRTSAADWYVQPSTTRLADLRDRLARFDRVRAVPEAAATQAQAGTSPWTRRDLGVSSTIGREADPSSISTEAASNVSTAGSSNGRQPTDDVINGVEIYDQAIRDWRARAHTSTTLSASATSHVATSVAPDNENSVGRPSWRTAATAGSRYGQWRAERVMGADGNDRDDGEGEQDLSIPGLMPTYPSRPAAEGATVPAPRTRATTGLFGESPGLIAPEVIRLPRAYQQPESRATAALASDTAATSAPVPTHLPAVPRGNARPTPISPTSSRAVFARMQGLDWPPSSSSSSTSNSGAGTGAGLDPHPFLRRAEMQRRLHPAFDDVEDSDAATWDDLNMAAGPASAEVSSTASDREGSSAISGWSNEAVANGGNNRGEPRRSPLFPNGYASLLNGTMPADLRAAITQGAPALPSSTWTPAWTHPGERHRQASTAVRDPTLLLSGASVTARAERAGHGDTEERIRLARVQAMVEAEALAAIRRGRGGDAASSGSSTSTRDIPPYLVYPTSRAQMQTSYRSLFHPNGGRSGAEADMAEMSRMEGRPGPIGPGVADGYVGHLDSVGDRARSAGVAASANSTAWPAHLRPIFSDPSAVIQVEDGDHLSFYTTAPVTMTLPMPGSTHAAPSGRSDPSANHQSRSYHPLSRDRDGVDPPTFGPDVHSSTRPMPTSADYRYAHPSTLLHPGGLGSRADVGTFGQGHNHTHPQPSSPYANSAHALPNLSSSIVVPLSADMPASEKRAFTAMISRAVGRLSGASRRGAAESVLTTVKYQDWDEAVSKPMQGDDGGYGQRKQPPLRTAGVCPYAGNVAAAKEMIRGALSKIVGGMQKEATCSICHDDYEPGSEIDVTPCKHSYHKECLEMWLNQPNSTTASCPMCRRDMAVLACLARFVPNHDMHEAHAIWMNA